MEAKSDEECNIPLWQPPPPKDLLVCSSNLSNEKTDDCQLKLSRDMTLKPKNLASPWEHKRDGSWKQRKPSCEAWFWKKTLTASYQQIKRKPEPQRFEELGATKQLQLPSVGPAEWPQRYTLESSKLTSPELPPKRQTLTPQKTEEPPSAPWRWVQEDEKRKTPYTSTRTSKQSQHW